VRGAGSATQAASVGPGQAPGRLGGGPAGKVIMPMLRLCPGWARGGSPSLTWHLVWQLPCCHKLWRSCQTRCRPAPRGGSSRGGRPACCRGLQRCRPFGPGARDQRPRDGAWARHRGSVDCSWTSSSGGGRTPHSWPCGAAGGGSARSGLLSRPGSSARGSCMRVASMANADVVRALGRIPLGAKRWLQELQSAERVCMGLHKHSLCDSHCRLRGSEACAASLPSAGSANMAFGRPTWQLVVRPTRLQACMRAWCCMPHAACQGSRAHHCGGVQHRVAQSH